MSWSAVWSWLRGIRLPWLLLALAIGWGALQTVKASNARERAAQAALRATNEAAAHDSTRKLAGKVAELLGDSLQAVQRLVLQQQQRGDQLDRALGLERIAAAGLRVRIRDLEATIAGTPVHEDSGTKVRRSDFTLRQPPYLITATAILPPPPALGSLIARVQLDSIRLGLRLGCGKADKDGIRPAAATVTGPPWAELTITAVEQSEDLCQSPALKAKAPSRLKWAAIGAGVALIVEKLTGLIK